MKKETQIPELKIQIEQFRVRGTAPLIVHKFSEKAIKMIEAKQAKKSKQRPERNPQQEMLDTMYFFPDKKRSGFPAVGFKAAMVRGAKSLDFVMKDIMGQIFVIGDQGTDLVEIQGVPELKTDMVRVGMGAADIRYRAMYPEWEANITIKFNSSVISTEQIAQIIQSAGFSCGVGEWRPEKSKTGNFGTFELTDPLED